jgi:replicative DNA helicase
MDKIQLRSEQLVINSILTEPTCIHKVMARVNLDMFELPMHKLIFENITKLYLDQQPINLISVYKSIQQDNSIYSKTAVVELSTLHSMFHAQERMELESAIVVLTAESIRHEHIDLGNKIIKESSSDTYDPKKTLDIIQSHISDNKYKSLLNKKEFTNEDLLVELDKRMADAASHKGVSGIETGYKRFDLVTSGMQPTNLIIVAARPAMGKTQYALGIMRHASIKNNKKGLFISCEMDEVQVMKRIIAVDSGIPGYHIKRGNLHTSEVMKYEKARQRIIESNLRIVAGSFTISDVLSLIYKMKHSEGLDYVVVDYIQKITSPGAQNRTNEVGDVSRRLKDLANELKIPIVALAQLSRAVEHRTDKKPMLSDLRESGDIEQDADIVMFLYRAGYYMDINERQNNPMADDGYAIIAKHRDGELEDIQLKFDSNIPAWKNPDDRDEYNEIQVQQQIKPNYDFDWDKPFG